jgi:hypothetical protein
MSLKRIMNKVTPLRAIREYCLECSNNSFVEVKNCPVRDCPLYLYRLGRNPKRSGIGGNPKFR